MIVLSVIGYLFLGCCFSLACGLNSNNLIGFIALTVVGWVPFACAGFFIKLFKAFCLNDYNYLGEKID